MYGKKNYSGFHRTYIFLSVSSKLPFINIKYRKRLYIAQYLRVAHTWNLFKMSQFLVLFINVSVFAFYALCMDPLDLDLPSPPAVSFLTQLIIINSTKFAVELGTNRFQLLNFRSLKMSSLAIASLCTILGAHHSPMMSTTTIISVRWNSRIMRLNRLATKDHGTS